MIKQNVKNILENHANYDPSRGPILLEAIAELINPNNYKSGVVEIKDSVYKILDGLIFLSQQLYNYNIISLPKIHSQEDIDKLRESINNLNRS